MANPDQLPPEEMAEQFGIGRLSRHLFVCLGPDCVDPASGVRTWEYFMRRLKEIKLSGPLGWCFRT